ncbi:MAG TPA: hypothetical protein VGI12_21005 [Vicinamibacterales bacterium]|jgi:hypothetical protein
MKRVYVRAFQLAVLTLLALVVSSRPSAASEWGCFSICIYDDWSCIFATGHPADSCGYDSASDICTLGGCQLGAMQ